MNWASIFAALAALEQTVVAGAKAVDAIASTPIAGGDPNHPVTIATAAVNDGLAVLTAAVPQAATAIEAVQALTGAVTTIYNSLEGSTPTAVVAVATVPTGTTAIPTS